MTLWNSSTKRLYDPRVSMRLKKLFDLVIKTWPFPAWSLQVGRDGAYRTPERQRELYDMKPPRTKTLKSKHMEGRAIDITLYWEGTERAIWDRLAYAVVMGHVFHCAHQLGLTVIWGGDWNRNWNLLEKNNWEVDLVHVELADG